jgi:HK97 family phage portal protein
MLGLASHKFVSRLERTLGTEVTVDAAFSEQGSRKLGLLPREDDSTLMQTYEKSIWVYNAVSVIAEVSAQIPLKIYKKQAKKITDLTYDKIMEPLRHPNPWMSRFRLWEATVSFLRLCGDCYWEITPSKSKPEFIYVIRPDLMEIVPDKNNLIKEYRYYPKGRGTGDPVIFRVDNIVHFKAFHPTDSFYGMSSISPAQLSIAADLLALQYQIKFYENNARPDGVFSTDIFLSDTQIELLEKNFIKFSPIILHGGLKYNPISSDLKDLELTDARKVNRQDIISGQRSGPAIMGLEDGDYSNLKEQLQLFLYTRVLPMMRGLASDLDTLLLRYIAPNLEASFDIEELPEYVNELEKETQMRIRFQNGLVSVNEARMGLKLAPLEDKEAGEERFILSTLMRIDEAKNLSEQNTGPGGAEQRPDSNTRPEPSDEDDDNAGQTVGNEGEDAPDSERQ